MIITMVCDVLGKENNGTTIAAMNLYRSLKAKGHTVKILCPDKDKQGQENYFVVPTYNLGIFNNYVKKNGVVIAKKDTQIIKKAIQGSDIIHVMIPFSLARSAIKIAKELNIPVTAGFHAQAENITNHIFLMNSKFVNRCVYKNFYNKFYKHVDAVHYPTKFIRDVFEKNVGKTNGYVISNGVNTRFVKKTVQKPDNFKDKFVILFTGRYSKEKSHKVLIDAVKYSKYKDKIQLVFAGDGPLKTKLQKYCKKNLKNQPLFKFFGREEMVDTINYADLYVHPAEIEIEAIACLEAISCGLVPVIANSPRCATKAFALDDNNLFKNKDSKSLANKIDYWISHPEEKKIYQTRYEDFVKEFNQDICMDKMEEMLIETVQKHKAG